MTTDDLLKEQNRLLAEQNKLLKSIADKSSETQSQRFARMADTWDKRQGAVGRFLWVNPYRR